MQKTKVPFFYSTPSVSRHFEFQNGRQNGGFFPIFSTISEYM